MYHVRRFTVAAMALLLAGCLQSVPTNYHTLVPQGPDAPALAPPAAIVVGLEPVTLPAAFDRSEILLTNGPNSIELSPSAAWLGPLDQTMTLVIAEDLAGYLGVDQVFLLPTRRFVELDRVVEVDVVQLIVDPVGAVHFEAVWRIYGDRDELARSGRTTAEEGFAPGADLAPAVAAINRTLDQLARTLAVVIANS